MSKIQQHDWKKYCVFQQPVVTCQLYAVYEYKHVASLEKIYKVTQVG